MASIWISYLSFQANSQAKLRPATWLNFAFKNHSEEVEWEFRNGSDLGSIKSAIITAAKELDNYHTNTYRTENENKIILYYITPGAKWLDVIEITLSEQNNRDENTKDNTSSTTIVVAKVLCASTGVLPISIPLSFIWNILLCWVPFLDVGMNRKEHEQLSKNLIEKQNIKLQSSIIRPSAMNPVSES